MGGQAPGGSDIRTIQVSVPEPGFYRVVLEAVAQPAGRDPVREYDIANETRYTYWLYVPDAGSGQILRSFNQELVPDGSLAAPGPFRPTREAWRAANRAQEAGLFPSLWRRLRSVLPFFSTQVVVNVTYQPLGVGSAIPAEGVRLGGIRWDEETPIDTADYEVGSSGQILLPCLTGEEWTLWSDLGTSESDGGTHGATWGECGDTVNVVVTEYYYEAFEAMEEAIDRIDTHLGYTRSIANYFVSEEGCGWREIAPGDTVGWACYSSGTDVIKMSHHWITQMAGLVSAHEYGHALHHESLGGLWPTYGTCSGHTRDTPSSHICALQEGFAAYLENIGSDTFLIGDWDTLHFTHHDSAGSIEGNVSALLADLIDATSDGDDATNYSGYYVATVFKTCETSPGSVDRNGVDQLIWCLENRVNSGLQSTHFPGRTSWTGQSESATEPGSWDEDDIRDTWLQNVGVDEPPLSVFINGQASVGEYEYCTFVATVSNGSPPYSYSWSGLLSGSASSVSSTMTSSGTLYLTVTDDNSDQAFDDLTVYVSPSGPECVE